MGSTYRSNIVTFKNWDASVEVNWDPDDSGQVAGVIGSTITVDLYPEGETASDTRLTGSAIVEGVTETAPYDEKVTKSYTLRGQGALIRTTV